MPRDVPFFAGPAALRDAARALTDAEVRVLWVLATHCQAPEFRCYLAMRTIAENAGKSERAAQLILRRLENAGAITTAIGEGPGGVNVYTLAGAPMPAVKGGATQIAPPNGGGRNGDAEGAQSEAAPNAEGAQSNGQRGASQIAPKEKEKRRGGREEMEERGETSPLMLPKKYGTDGGDDCAQVDDPRDLHPSLIYRHQSDAAAAFDRLPKRYQRKPTDFRRAYAWALHRHGLTSADLDAHLAQRYSASDARAGSQYVPLPSNWLASEGWRESPEAWAGGGGGGRAADVFAQIESESEMRGDA